MLTARVITRLGRLQIDLELEVAAGQTLALLGPNGAGKTSVLRTIAGLLPLDDGFVQVDDEPWDEPSTGAWIEPHRRRIGYLFQEYLLFPHMSALENVAYGLRRTGASQRDARVSAEHWLERVGLADHASARPSQLSGGQAQRVALARALAVGPEVLLLDEPLAALDAVTRVEIREELRRHLGEFAGPTVMVTHDPDDARALGDTVIVMEDGRMTGRGPLDEVLAAPSTPYQSVLAAARRGGTGGFSD